MSASTAYRDHFQAANVDFDTLRFVVCKGNGLNVAGKHLEMGDEVPKGALSSALLRAEYEPPLHRIEVLDVALQDPILREACARMGVVAEPKEDPKPQVVLPPLHKLTHEELILLCESNELSADGTKKQLRARLEALLG